jgi:hypothetical protein
MDKRELNRRINGLKDAYPEELALIEGIQDLLNKKIEVISEKNRQALRQFPMQFTRRVDLGDGEWTTTLHMWADNMVDTLLEIDPLILTCTNSRGESVLHALVFAATGRFTQMVNYDLIQKMLEKNMSFIEMTVPNNVNSKVEGNAWVCKDALQKTPMDYLVDFANGDGDAAPDERLQQMLYEFGSTPAVEPPVDNTPQMPVTDEQLMAVDQQSGVGPDGQVNPNAVQAEPQSNLPDTPDLSTAQKQQDAVNAGANPEKEISAATPVAQAAANGKPTEDEEKDSPILETLLRMTL